MTLAASTSTDKSLKDFDELMSTLIDFSSYVLNGLKIENLTQEVLLGPTFRLFKGTRSNYAELKYDFKECYKALSEKLDWENTEGGDYPFDLSKPFPLITRGKLMQSRGYLFAKRILAVTSCLESSEWDISGDFRINDIEDMLILVVQNRLTNLSGDDVADFTIALRMFTRSLVIQNPYKDPQGFIYVDDIGRNRLMHSDELYKFSDGTLTRLLSSLEDITKNINMTYLPKRRWSTLETKRSHFMIKGGGDINKMQKEGGMMGLGEILLVVDSNALTSELLQRTSDFEYLKMVMEVPDSS
ncbi:hypothetical protein Tco_0551696 [Tanacetum coccineum]